MRIKPPFLAVLFDLDGVIVSSDKLHFLAWRRIAQELNIQFSKADNEKLKGVSREVSLKIILKASKKKYSSDKQKQLINRKNSYFKKLIPTLSKKNILPGVLKLIKTLKNNKIKIAIASASKNTKLILKVLNLQNTFDAIVDGNQVKKTKPNPEVFLRAASLLSTKPEQCLVIEDSIVGVEAGVAAGMKVLAIGSARIHPSAKIKAKSLSRISYSTLVQRTIQ